MLAAVVAIFISSCSSTQKVVAPPVADHGVTDEYKIGVGDILQINVWRNAELSMSVPVRPDGKISMPLIGDIAAANITTKQLSANIVEALANFVRSPQVTVIVSNPSSSDFQLRVRVTGAVRSPQSIAYREGMTVLDLVLMAGGPNEFASGNKAKLYRKFNGETKVYAVHIQDILEDGKLETNYPLQPSDIVTIPERSF
jgi:polysaccharide export outer membrane protein